MSTAHEWIREHARPLEDVRPIVAAAKAATVVAVGENTREAAEIDRHRIGVTKALVEEAGYRVIVIPDSANVAERMDDYVLGRRSDLREVVLSGWPPNRSEATAALLAWVRAFNEEHADSPVRIVGNGPKQIEPEDYDRVLDHAARLDPAAAAGLRERYDVVRTAHDVGEHIQIHQGTHPGRPFAELAREALDLVRDLPEGASKAAALESAGQIRDFHANSVAAKPDFGEISRGIADRIVAAHEADGQKVVYFDGFALTGVLSAMEVAVNPGRRFASAGHLLRERFGDAYVSVLLAFGRGTIRGGMVIPEAGEGHLEKTLLDGGVGEVLLDLRGGGWPDEAARLRIVAGVYSPEEDGKHGIDLPSPREAADFLGFVPVVSQTPPLTA
jgi:erythromycin esterase